MCFSAENRKQDSKKKVISVFYFLDLYWDAVILESNNIMNTSIKNRES